MRTAAMTTANRHRRSPLGLFPERPTPRLDHRVVEIFWVGHDARSTAKAYVHWIGRYIRFHSARPRLRALLPRATPQPRALGSLREPGTPFQSPKTASRTSARLIESPSSRPHAAPRSAAKFNGVFSVIAARRDDKTLHVSEYEVPYASSRKPRQPETYDPRNTPCST